MANPASTMTSRTFAYLAMASKHLAADIVMAYPTAQIAVMEATGAANIIFRKEIAAAEDPEKVKDSIVSSAKLSSREYLPILIARALPGIRLDYLPAPPQELPKRAGTCYFSIDSHSDQWTAVEQGKNVALYWDTAPEDIEAELMVVEVS